MRIPGVFVLGASTVACAYAPPPADIVQAERAVLHADQAGAGEDSTATLYLRLAERRIRRARAAAARGDVESARSEATRARADAEVAIVVAREAAVRHAARRAEAEASVLAERLRR